MKNDNVSFHYNRAVSLCLIRLEKAARQSMRKYPDLKEFIMEPGQVCFVTSRGEPRYTVALEDEYRYLRRINNILEIWEKPLDLSSHRMRFTLHSKKVTQW